MKHLAIALLVIGIAALANPGVPTLAGDDDGRTLRATLRGIEEPPSVSSTGRGTFRATISEDGTSLSYTISYEDLEGDVQQSHIHLGQKGVNGGVAVFLCTNLANGPAGTPACPGPRAGTVSGTVTGEQIVGPTGQGLAPGEFAELLRAIDRKVTYANVHSLKHPTGEIRGQIEGED
jgi:CHRD domain